MADRKEIAEKIKGAQNILVALSKDPNVDEVSAALGLTLMLDKIGKKATAIYSGGTPDALKFLSPEKTFSADTNALQDFIIALDKDKADHLRYKVDGDYVKVFITPYHEAISEDDLEYSYGDFNVDLIIALDVASNGDLDGALSEYGRIMHDAGAVNITTNEGGKFSDIEWCDANASSVCEMVAELGAELGEDTFEKNSATALLTGIVSSTERFANEKTTPETMGVAAKLMAAGADQRLIAENIERAENGKEPVMLDSEPALEETSSDKENNIKETEEKEMNFETMGSGPSEAPESIEAEKTEEVENPEETSDSEKAIEPEPSTEPEPEKPVLETPSDLLGDLAPMAESTTVATDESKAPVAEEPSVEPEAPAAEEAPATEPETPVEPGTTPEPESSVAGSEAPAETNASATSEVPAASDIPKFSENAIDPSVEDTRRKSVKLQPSAEAQAELEKLMQEEPKKNELLEEMNKASEQVAAGGLKPDVGLSSIDTDSIGKKEVKDYGELMAAALNGDDGMPNPAVQAAPAVASGPEANHIPEMDYSQPSSEPAEQPPVMQNGMLEPVAPATEPAGVAHEGMMATTEAPASSEPGMVAASEGMNGDILPPPPAPPVDGSMMPPVAPEAAPVAPEAPAAPVTTPVTPVETPSSALPVTPVIPVVPPAAPEAPAAPAQVGPVPTNDDPSAFRIPGM